MTEIEKALHRYDTALRPIARRESRAALLAAITRREAAVRAEALEEADDALTAEMDRMTPESFTYVGFMHALKMIRALIKEQP